MVTEVVLQPILKDSQIPFDKYLLLYDGASAVTGKLHAIKQEGFVFRRIGEINLFEFLGNKELGFNPTHYAILNIVLQK